MPVYTPHPQYQAKQARWQKQRDAFAGEDVVKPKGQTYLPKPSGFSSGMVSLDRAYDLQGSEYSNYVARAKWYDGLFRTKTALSGVATSKPPTIHAGDYIKEHFVDITLSGVTLDAFILETISELLLIGRYGILLMWGEDRPKWVGYNAERIINWHTETINGRTVYTLIVLQEDVEFIDPNDGFEVKTECRYRVLYLNQRGEFSVSRWAKGPRERDDYVQIGSPEVPLRNGEPLDFIPFVIINSTSIGPNIEKGILEGLASLAFDYYRHSADYEHGLHLTALPTGVITGNNPEDGDLYVGSSTFLQIQQSEAKVYFLEFHGHGLQSHEKAMETDKAEMANIGAKLLEPMPEVEETLGAFRMRHASDTGSLRSVVNMASQAFTWILQIHSWWARDTEKINDPNVFAILNTDFVSARIPPQDLQALMEALNSGYISFETWIWNLKQGEVLPPDVDAETERDRIESQPPARIPLLGSNATIPPTVGTRNGRTEDDDESLRRGSTGTARAY